ncbi:S-methyl-5'-thioadenosine phosphorylase [Streptomyces sp. NPDC092296]|uniref:S-methyl-5'-thioadenosine phosphorylase n=1 Tax=Streptomyces sp. NPDC092296 TaxID=3366012 RepID=UPI00382B25F6
MADTSSNRTAGSPVDIAPVDVGVIGGSGFYAFLDDVTEVAVDTPYGPPSDSVVVGEVGGRRVAFLPRHGRGHHLPPHRINYRANLWALRSLGARQVLGPCAVGGLRPEYGPGTLVVPDQLVDRTSGRVQTFYDGVPLADGRVPAVVHVSLADPYCPVGRQVALTAARGSDWEPVDGGTLVVIEGPRFSTRAESRWYAAQGWSVVGMTGHPEAVLARELGLCYTSISLVTDLDAGVETGEGVTHDEVLAVFAQNVGRLRTVLFDVVAGLPAERDCICSHALDGLETGLGL